MARLRKEAKRVRAGEGDTGAGPSRSGANGSSEKAEDVLGGSADVGLHEEAVTDREEEATTGPTAKRPRRAAKLNTGNKGGSAREEDDDDFV